MSTVIYKKTSNRVEFITKVFETEQIVEKIKGKTVLIKPNMVSYEPYPTTTHPESVITVVNLLKSYAKELVIGDGKAYDCNVDITLYPIAKLCHNLSVKFIDFSNTKMNNLRTKSGFDLEFSQMLMEFEFIISLPVLKYNFTTGITGALKNQYGFLSDREKEYLHKNKDKNIHKAIAELSRIRKPDFYIVDAIQTMIGAQEKRHGGKIAELSCIFAGKDPVSLDAYGFETLKDIEKRLKRFFSKPKPEQIEHIKFAEEFDIGKINYELKPI